MKDLLDKLSSYDVLNYLFPGVLFAALVPTVTKYTLIQSDIVIGVFVYYFIGLAISRFGSLIIEPILIKLKFIKFVSHKNFVKAATKNDRLEILSVVNNMYRTLISMLVLLLLLKLYQYIAEKYTILNNYGYIGLIIILLILFILAYIKQTKYVKNSTKEILELADEEDADKNKSKDSPNIIMNFINQLFFRKNQ